MKVVYFGTPPFAAQVLDVLIKKHVEIVAVVTKPDKPKGRSATPVPSAVKRYILDAGLDLPVLQPAKVSVQDYIDQLKALQADLFVVVAYGEIVSQSVLDLAPLGCINLHASLLPKYRGAAPIQYALLEGVRESGVTVIEMVKKMDAGPMLAQKKVEIPEEMNCQELEVALCHLGAQTLFEVINQYQSGQIVEKVCQDESLATYVKKIDSTQAQINWELTARDIHNRIRAFSPRPGAWCFVEVGGKVKRLKILRSQVEEGDAPTGETVLYDREGWKIGCREGVLRLLEVQLEGKQAISAQEFQRGYPNPLKIKT